MEILRTISKLNNKESDCPYKIEKCELLSDTENFRIALRLNLAPVSKSAKKVFVDVCCYDSIGNILSVMKNIPYINGGMMVSVSSFMTTYAAVIVRSAEFDDGVVWKSNIEFAKTFCEDDDFEDTMRMDLAEEVNEVLKNENPKNNEQINKSLSKIEEPKIDIEDEEDERPLTKKEIRKQKYLEEEEIRNLIKTDPAERKKRRITRLITFLIIIVVALGGFFGLRYKIAFDSDYKAAFDDYNGGRYEKAFPVLEKLDSKLLFGEKKKEVRWAMAMSYARTKNYGKSLLCFKKLDDYKESKANYRSILSALSKLSAAGKEHSIALKENGTVLAVGDNTKEQCDIDSCSDVKRLAAGDYHSVALKFDNTVVATGDNSNNQCNVEEWKDIIDISAGGMHTVGVENVGRVVATGNNDFGQCDVENWSGIIFVDAGKNHTVGLKLDGTVVATGDNQSGECNVSSWQNVVSVVAGNGYTAGLTFDGKILFTGDDSKGISNAQNIKEDISSLGGGDYNLLAVTTKGKVMAFGGNDKNQCLTDLWKNIISATGGERHSIGITSDGTAFGNGENSSGQASVSDWQGIGIPKNSVEIRKGE